MNLQFIADSEGKTKGVFIPIKVWNRLKDKYKGIEQEEMYIPEWQKDLARERLEVYQKNPETADNFDSAMDDIEKEL